MNQMGAVAILGGALVFVVFACRSPGDINPQGGRSAIDAIVGAAIGEAPSGRGDAKPLEVDIMLPLAELIPDPLWVGEDVAIRVHPLLSYGGECMGCTIRWHTGDSAIARFTDVDPP